MYDSVFDPPNLQHLSDSVIGEVRQRKAGPTHQPAIVRKHEFLDDSTTLNADEPSTALSGYKRLNVEPDDLREVTRLDLVKMQRRRQQRRDVQKRYRQKKIDEEATLEEDAWLLRQEVIRLEHQRCEVAGSTAKSLQRGTSRKKPNIDMYGPTLSKLTCWGAAVEYFRLFRNGLKTSVSSFGTSNKPSESLQLVDSWVQVDFLRDVFAPDVVYDTVIGVEALLEKWKHVSILYPDIDIRVVRLERGAHCSVVATVKGTHTIYLDTIRYGFPHLIDGDSLSPLATKLLGQQLEVEGKMRFSWDDKTKCITAMQSQADMMTPMLRILGSLEKVARVFENASIKPDCRF